MRFVATALLGAVLAAATFVVVLSLSDLQLTNDPDSARSTASTPFVMNEDIEDARAEVLDAGLRTLISGPKTPPADGGRYALVVKEQRPQGGVRVPIGSRVHMRFVYEKR